VSRLRTVGKALASLFVEDGRFALLITVWLSGCALLRRLPLPSRLVAFLLFGGLAVILVWSAAHRARMTRRP
jgi:hypothetical protein